MECVTKPKRVPRKKRTVQVQKSTLPKSPGAEKPRAFRKLSKSDLKGVIFGCDNKTIEECFSKRLFGLPGNHICYVKNIQSGLPLFLFNYKDRKMYGIYVAAGQGKMNIDPHAWTGDPQGKTIYPAQVPICVMEQCKPLKEKQFKKIIAGNYFERYKFLYELDNEQTNGLLALFRASPIVPRNGNHFTESAAANSQLIFNSERLYSGPSELRDPEAFTRLANRDDFSSLEDGHGDREPSSTSETSSVASEQDELRVASDSHSGASFSHGGEFEMLSEQLYSGEKPSEEEMRGGLDVPKLSVDRKHPTSSSAVSIDAGPFPSNSIGMHKESSLPRNSPVLIEAERPTASDTYERNAELVEIIKELKERTGALEKRQFESDQEILELRNVAKGSGIMIQELVGCVKELEHKLMRLMGSGNVIYLIGGFNGTSYLSALDSFSPSSDILMPLKAMSSARSRASAAALNGNLYVFGGEDGSSLFKTVECYNQWNSEWTLCPPLKCAKGSLAGATLNNKIFALGGGNGAEYFADVEMFDPALGRWNCYQPMLQKRSAPAAAELNGVLYTVGGYDGKECLDTGERLDPRVGYWTRLPNMKARRTFHSLSVLNEKLYAVGGSDGKRIISSVEVFDPRLGSWMMAEPLNFARGYGAAAVLGDSLFAIGGLDGSSNIVEAVECYKEASGWTTYSSKAIGRRYNFSAIVT